MRMRVIMIIICVIVIISTIIIFSRYPKYNIPEKAIDVSQLLADPVYYEEVMIYGSVSALNELDCPCFYLTSGGKTVAIWYDEYNNSLYISQIRNGDMLGVNGHLDEASKNTVPPKFVPSAIWVIFPLYESAESPPLMAKDL